MGSQKSLILKQIASLGSLRVVSLFAGSIRCVCVHCSWIVQVASRAQMRSAWNLRQRELSWVGLLVFGTMQIPRLRAESSLIEDAGREGSSESTC